MSTSQSQVHALVYQRQWQKKNIDGNSKESCIHKPAAGIVAVILLAEAKAVGVAIAGDSTCFTAHVIICLSHHKRVVRRCCERVSAGVCIKHVQAAASVVTGDGEGGHSEVLQDAKLK